jgi:hypothetical protein
MKKEIFEKIAQESFVDELEKVSGKKSEIAAATGLAAGNIATYAMTKDQLKKGITPELASEMQKIVLGKKIGKIMGPITHFTYKHPGKYMAGSLIATAAIPAVVGLIQKTKSKEEMLKQDKKTFSNIITAPYNLGRRIKTALSNKK